jgi:tetratricopeptide (TPR) repeat protein
MPPIVSITAANSQQAAQAGQEAIALQNMGLQYERTGDFAGAERAFLRSLELKQLACAPGAATFGITHNSLGELYLAMGPARLGDADTQLQRAHAVREALAAQSVQHAFDAAVTRENLARVAECRGDREGARRMRKKGTMVCSNYNVRPSSSRLT